MLSERSKGSMRALPVLQQVRLAEPALRPLSAGAEPPWLHLIAGERPLVLIVDGSRVFEVSPDFFEALAARNEDAELSLRTIIPVAADVDMSSEIISEPIAVSLNIAQTCNLSCTYCYADEGLFGGRPRMMTEEIAHRVIDRIIDDADGRTVTVGFIGGEPFLNRKVLHDGVSYARERGRNRGVTVRFSVTTNATLLQSEDIALLRDNAFAISVSLDGDASSHDRHRRSRNGSSSYAAATTALRPLLQNPGPAKIAARATLTRHDLRVAERIEALAAEGFQEIGVSPLRTSPDASLILAGDDWSILLTEMIRAAEVELSRFRQGAPLRFSNLAVALKEIHRGACRPLPCGAALNYVSVSVDGDYFTCHRTIGDQRLALGNLATGPLRSARQRFVTARHVDTQEPCASCWARYLCGGGCHAEVIAAGRSGCDYIRGWLEYCLRTYNQVLVEQPGFFDRER